jgi:anti-sigma factor RsiW
MSEHDSWHLLSAFLDGALSPGERCAVEEHLRSCEACRRELEAFRGVKSLASGAPRRPFPPGLMAEIERALPGPSRAGAFLLWWTLPRHWAPAGAAVLASLVLGLWAGWRAYSTEEEIPLEPLLAAHARYAAEASTLQADPVASGFSANLADYHGG